MKYIIAGIFLFSSLNVSGGFEGGTTLLDACDTPKSSDVYYQSNARCIGYISGVFDLADGILFCAPKEVTRGQVWDIAVKYLREHPEQRHTVASDSVIESLREVFPCPKK